MCLREGAPGPPPRHADTDSRSPRNRRVDAHAAILDEEAAAAEIDLILLERDPHRHRHIAGPAAEIVRAKRSCHAGAASLPRSRPPTPHRRDAFERIER